MKIGQEMKVDSADGNMAWMRAGLRDWYLANQRSLPWRETTDPYRIWVSEIILQQTRVKQGLDYYKRFIERFPSIRVLAEASEEQVLKAWEGLGYYSRARNMHATARKICNELNGRFPDSYNGLIGLRGIGPYTAAAVSSISFAEPRSVVDGNVHRVISRVAGIEEAPGNYTASSGIVRFAAELLDNEDPGTHNQAIMELGALVCTPVSPACNSCPLQKRCIAHREQRVEELPIKPKKTKIRIRHFNYIVIIDMEGIWIGRRSTKGIWEGLYEFPLIETGSPASPDTLRQSEEWKELFGDIGISIREFETTKHILSHQEIRARFFHAEGGGIDRISGYLKLPFSELKSLPFPRLILNHLEKILD